jgi:tetratricopeptide (TPR) repeat protein
MTKLITIQEATPLSDSIRYQLSDITWQWGETAFFSEKVPFSGRSNPKFASHLSKLYQAHINALPSELPTYHVYEFGAGLGLLSKHFLDHLKETAPEIYKKTILHVTELSSSTVKKLQEISIFYDHIDQVRFQTMNATNISFDETQKPIFAFSSYLLSSLSTKLILSKNNKLEELYVKTSLPEDSKIIDTTTYPPQILNTNQIKTLLEKNDTTTLKIIGTKIKKILQEEYITININNSNLTTKSKDEITSFATNKDINNNSYFSFNTALKKHIKQVTDGLAENGVYFVSDLGKPTLNTTNFKLLLANYGGTASTCLSFPQFKTITSALNLDLLSTTRTTHDTQEVLIGKSINKPLKKSFNSLFSVCPLENIQKSLDKLNKLDKNNSNPEQVNIAIANLSATERKDYLLLKRAAAILFKSGHLANASKFTAESHKIYLEYAIDAFLITGWICQKQGFHNDATICFKQAIQICPNMHILHSSLASSQIAQNLLPECITSFKKAIRFSKDKEIWDYTLGIGVNYKRIGKIAEANETFSWPLEILKKHPNLIPVDRAAEIKSYFNLTTN